MGCITTTPITALCCRREQSTALQPRPGTEVAWTEPADRSQNPITLDAGQKMTEPALTALPSKQSPDPASANAIIAAIG
jgi:hypothetical protein